MQSSTTPTTTSAQSMVPQLLILTLFWIGLQLVASWVKADFSHVSQFIGEINATNTKNAGVLGWVGFIPLAMVTFSVLISVRSRLNVKGPSIIGWLLLFAWPLNYLLAALAPCDAGCPVDGSSAQAINHFVLMVCYFAMALAAVLLATTPKTYWAVRIALLLLACIIVLGYLLMTSYQLMEIRGAIQRVVELSQLAVFWLLLGLANNQQQQ